MSFDPYAELGIPRFVPTGKPVSLKPFSIKRGSGGYIPQKVKSQVVAEKKAEVKKKVIVKRAKEKVKKIVLARKLKGGRRTKQEMSEARGMGMEDKVRLSFSAKRKGGGRGWGGRERRQQGGISAKELMKKGVMRAKKGQWNKMLEEIPLKERIKTIIQPLLDSGDITEGGETQYYMKRLNRYAPYFSQQVLDKYERGVSVATMGEDLTDTGYKQEKRTSLFTITDKVPEAYNTLPNDDRRGEVSYPKFKALHPEIFKKLNELFGNASTRELRKLAVNMPSAPTKNDMINEVINFVVFGTSRRRLTYGFKAGEGGADTEGTTGRYGWDEGHRDRDFAPRYDWWRSGVKLSLRTLGKGISEKKHRARTRKTKFLEKIIDDDDDDDDDDEPIEEVESAPETDSDYDYNDTDEEERDKALLMTDEESDEYALQTDGEESDFDFY